jgi:hypothetical protein
VQHNILAVDLPGFALAIRQSCMNACDGIRQEFSHAAIRAAFHQPEDLLRPGR